MQPGGVDVAVVQEVLGHSESEMSLLYLDDMKLKEAAMSKLGTLQKAQSLLDSTCRKG
jgi:hypothetical protein